MTRELRWTERATEQLAVIAEYISITSPVYAEQVVERIGSRFEQVLAFPESGRTVPEAREGEPLRELIERPLSPRVRSPAKWHRGNRHPSWPARFPERAPKRCAS